MTGDDEEVATFLNLDKVVQQYGARPELLELILSSKVEEDRRRAEEAKLRRKEIDYLLQQHQQKETEDVRQNTSYRSWRSTNKPLSKNRPSLLGLCQHVQKETTGTLPRLPVPQRPGRDSTRHPALPYPTYSGSDPSLIAESIDNGRTEPVSERRTSNTSNTIHMLLTSPKSTNSSATLPPISISQTSPKLHPHPPITSRLNSKRQCMTSDDDSEDEDHLHRRKPFSTGLAPPSPPSESLILKQYHGKLPIPPVHTRPNKRRRREMQAITTIIETREFPYNDDYLWKNNGNTVHKKSGHKSIYYKCSNSSKGCPVNKTVTFKENGQYLIKYRGGHLNECSRIKRIVET
ncbi:hypothetical protein DFQ28_011026 [Apophysomyces sp. BC1034]|nr:hypothetical protein DFQ29_009528 [Apophysomyces sp. BC1021]KAG0184512.1 hypothetical protein DFQ28_011026 [Apophysomyces sp. BC1034]